MMVPKKSSSNNFALKVNSEILANGMLIVG